MKTIVFFILSVLITSFVFSCSDNSINPGDSTDKGDYEILAKYDSIRSYPGGGGIFPIRINPLMGFEGKVVVKVIADNKLNAKLTNDSLNKSNLFTNIIIAPDSSMSITNTQILLIATHGDIEKEIMLNVDIYNWSAGEFDDSDKKLKDFEEWAKNQDFEFSELMNNNTFKYKTYPEILIVEHCTYISEKYEVRLCYHVMIPPHDWSMILIRPLNSIEAVKSARRETDGTISEIPISEYPILLGY